MKDCYTYNKLSNPYVYYPLYNNLLDYSGRNKHLTRVSYSSKSLAGTSSIYFPGTYIHEFPDLGIFGPTKNYSISLWFYLTATNNNGILFHPRHEYDITLRQWDYVSNKLTFVAWTGSAYRIEWQIPNLNTWYHVAVIWNYSKTTCSMFINGKIIGSMNTVNYVVPTGKNTIGGVDSGGGPGNLITGGIKNLLIYNRALTANEILNLYYSTNPTRQRNFLNQLSILNTTNFFQGW